MKKIIGYGIAAMIVYYGMCITFRELGSAAVKVANKLLSERNKKESVDKQKIVYEAYFED